jgi:hypothetical protein
MFKNIQVLNSPVPQPHPKYFVFAMANDGRERLLRLIACEESEGVFHFFKCDVETNMESQLTEQKNETEYRQSKIALHNHFEKNKKMKIVEIKSFRTSDGEVFECQNKAKQHQVELSQKADLERLTVDIDIRDFVEEIMKNKEEISRILRLESDQIQTVTPE